jgi:hypothetical protein
VFTWAEEEKEKLSALGDLPKSIEGALLKSIFHGFSHNLEDLTYDIREIEHLKGVYNHAGPSADITTITDKPLIIDYTVRMPRLKRLCIYGATSTVEIGQGASGVSSAGKSLDLRRYRL